MTANGIYSYREIKSQPDVLNVAYQVFLEQVENLKSMWGKGQFDHVLFTGCGSTYHLSKAAAAIFQSLTGIPAFFFPGSEIALFPEQVIPQGRKILLVAISRSGRTTETLDAVSTFRAETTGKVLSITCDSQSPLSQDADLSIAVDEAAEESIAQTRSFSTMMFLSQAFAALVSGEDVTVLKNVPEIIRNVMHKYEPMAKELGEDQTIAANYYLGSGLLYGIASEAMLKLKEMSLSISEPCHTLDFRHGPMSMVDDKTIIIGLISEKTLDQETLVMRDMAKLGARIFAISEKSSPLLTKNSNLAILETGLPCWARPVVYLPLLQLYAYYRAMSKGLNPDTPRNTDAVVILE